MAARRAADIERAIREHDLRFSVLLYPRPEEPDNVVAVRVNNLWRSTTRGGPYTLIAENISGVALGYVDKSVINGTNCGRMLHITSSSITR